MSVVRTSTEAQAVPDQIRSRGDNGPRQRDGTALSQWPAVRRAGDRDSGRQRLDRDDGQYASPLFGGPEQVFRYLGRYSHRVAISNNRLRELDDTHVAFEWKDYAAKGQRKVMRLSIAEFIRRFLLHVLAKGFVRIRHYGLLAGVNVATKLEQCRRLLGTSVTPRQARAHQTWLEWLAEWTGQDPLRCPHCQGPLTRYPLPRLLQPGSGVTTEALPQADSQRLAPVDSS
jgi:hypothetical protein